MKIKSDSDITHFQALSISEWDINKEQLSEFKNIIESREKRNRNSLEKFITDFKNGHLSEVHRTNNRRVFSPVTAMSSKQRSMLRDETGKSLIEIDCVNSQPFHLVHAMLNEGLKVEKELVEIVRAGKFYDLFQTDSETDRDKIKKEVFSFLCAKKINIEHKVFKKLDRNYPKFIKSLIVFVDGKSLAKYMQQLESNVWIDNVSAALMLMRISHCTVHDSVLFSREDASEVLAVVKAAFGDVVPKLRVKDLETSETYTVEEKNICLQEVFEKVEDLKHAFWNVKSGRYGMLTYDYDIPKMVSFMQRKGIAKFFTTDIAYVIVRNENNRLREIGGDVINKELVDAVKTLGVDSHLVDKKIKTLLDSIKSNLISILTDIKDNDIYWGEEDKINLFYKDHIVEVTSSGTKLIEYSDFDKIIWEKHVMKRNAPNLANGENAYEEGIFEKFFNNVIEEDQRSYARHVFGYTLQPKRDISKLKAIVINDANIDSSSSGGTGKGIISQALSEFLPTVIENGKGFSPNKQFSFQNINYDTRMFVIDDVVQNFNFESLFSIITEGLNVEKKYKQPMYIPAEKSPLFVLTTNRGIKGSDESDKRRRLDILLKKHYSAKYTPEDEFGCILFKNWETEEWNRFDYFMIQCAIDFLSEGLIEYSNKVLALKQLIADTFDSFPEFMDDKDWSEPQNKDELINEWETYARFKKMSKKKFTEWVKKYATYKNADFKNDRHDDTYTLTFDADAVPDFSDDEDAVPDF